MPVIKDGLFDGDWIEVAQTTGRSRRIIPRMNMQKRMVVAVYSIEQKTRLWRKVTDCANVDLADLASMGNFSPTRGSDPRTVKVVLEVDKRGVATIQRQDVQEDPKLRFEGVEPEFQSGDVRGTV